MKRWVKDILLGLSSSARVQELIGRNVAFSQYLMGIGAGSAVFSSGENVLIEKLKLLHANAKQSLCIFDVGSNKGQFLHLLFSGLNGHKIEFQVHAFEPGQQAFEHLSEQFAEYPNVVLNNFGLGAEGGKFDLFYDKAGSSLASLSRRRLDHFGIEFKHSEQVTLQRIDAYCEAKGIPALDLLKLDVEGHELNVLAGASRMFRERRIRMMSFEFGGSNIDSRTYFQDFWYFLNENGMGSIHRITPGGHLVRLMKYTELNEQFRTTNFLALQSDRDS